MKAEKIKKAVKSGYARVALQNISCCGTSSSCCGSSNLAEDISRRVGYTDEELSAVPEGANLGLGCGNPVALASLQEGEIVLDLGSGAGFDCFIAASKVGGTGKIIGVDMTPEMIEKATRNAQAGNFGNVEFRLGEIENLPVSDNQVDVVISNCVINLSPDKQKVFKEAFRVLKPGGRLMVSDMVLLKELPEAIKHSVEAYVGCIAGAAMKEDYLAAIRSAGFHEIELFGEDLYPIELMANDPIAQAICADLNLSAEKAKDLSKSIASLKVLAKKPR
jgi:SAM-dependent methyltransferase